MAATRLAHLLIVSAVPAAAGIGCLDEAGEAVDYWYAFKHPDGTKYTYSDPRRPELAAAAGGLDDKATALTRTLLQAYSSGVAYAMYSDAHPNGETVDEPLAHAKGVVAFTKDGGGFWLTHSLPHFPQNVARGFEGSWQTASHKYAQHFLCLSLGVDALTTLGTAMTINWPSVYDKAVPSFAHQAVPNFETWTSGKHHEEILSKVFRLRTVGGALFQLFAKSAKFEKDLYAGLVAPTLKEDLLAETWQNGQGNLPNACRGSGGVLHEVMTIRNVEIGGEAWTVKKEHSKWAVTTSGSVFCVGDINRQEGQLKRGGGTTCSSDKGLAEQMRRAVTKFTACTSAANRSLLV